MDSIKLFLLEEYKSAVQLTFHVDNQRVQLTKFFITIVGIVLGGIFALNKIDKGLDLLLTKEFFGYVLIFLWLTGSLIIAIMARLRKVQLEHFRIILNIRKHFGGTNMNFWNTVQLSELTLPQGPNWGSGTFFWMSLVIVINSSLLPLSMFFLLEISTCNYSFIQFLSMLMSLFILYLIYFQLSKSNPQIKYNASNAEHL